MSKASLIGFLIAGLMASAPLRAEAAQALDQARIHADYHNGDFDKVIKNLEAFAKTAKGCSRADSVFMEKHLAVVYAANPNTRELGRYHMFRLLGLSPSADLLDMFVGEEVDQVFDKVKKEFALQKSMASASRPAVAKPVPAVFAPVPTNTSTAAAPTAFRSNPPYETQAARTRPAPFATASPKTDPTAAQPPAQPPLRTQSNTFSQRVAASVRPASTIPTSASVSAQSVFAPSVATPRSAAQSIATIVKPKPIAPPEDMPGAPSRESGDAFKNLEWKDKGFWVGGGAALAVVAFTLFYANTAPPKEPAPAKIYAVPAKVSQ